MRLEGGCYCGGLRFVAEGEPLMKAQCHCRECQYISGGGPNFIIGMPANGFAYVRGKPAKFARADLAHPVTREFCPTCGTHLATKPPGGPMVVIKVGALDDPALYGGPEMAIYLHDKQSFHLVPEGIAAFERFPPR
ncbi:MAG: GFA family protein [Caulobacteraceae bacterium]|nr:GFA family protein [Caulobacteraceae bacterium]